MSFKIHFEPQTPWLAGLRSTHILGSSTHKAASWGMAGVCAEIFTQLGAVRWICSNFGSRNKIRHSSASSGKEIPILYRSARSSSVAESYHQKMTRQEDIFLLRDRVARDAEECGIFTCSLRGHISTRMTWATQPSGRLCYSSPSHVSHQHEKCEELLIKFSPSVHASYRSIPDQTHDQH